jgi:hypothetical protein
MAHPAFFYFTGGLVGIALMLLVDGTVYSAYANEEFASDGRAVPFGPLDFVPFVVGVIGLGALNAVSAEALKGTSVLLEGGQAEKAKAWVMVWSIVMFGSTIGGVWLALSKWLTTDEGEEEPITTLPGIFLAASSLCLLAAAFILRCLGLSSSDDGM